MMMSANAVVVEIGRDGRTPGGVFQRAGTHSADGVGLLGEMSLAVIHVDHRNCGLVFDSDEVNVAVLIEVTGPPDDGAIGRQPGAGSDIGERQVAVVPPEQGVAQGAVVPATLLQHQVDVAVAVKVAWQEVDVFIGRRAGNREAQAALGEAACAIAVVNNDARLRSAQPVHLAIVVEVKQGLPAGRVPVTRDVRGREIHIARRGIVDPPLTPAVDVSRGQIDLCRRR